MGFHLSSSLDRDALLGDFTRNGYVHIPNVLPSENATRLHKALIESTPWNLAFNDGDKHIKLSGSQVATMPKDKLNRLQQAIFASAQQNFQYCYGSYPIFEAHQAGQNKGHVLHQFYEWLNGGDFLEFARAVTGFDDLSHANAQATRYMPGHFLTEHDDSAQGQNRRAGFVFHLTRGWRADWGGYLQILDESGNVRRGFKPSFNALTVLAVPQMNNVSLVAPFAGGVRLSISGWMHFGEAPATSA